MRPKTPGGGKRVTCPTCGKTIEIPFSQERINTTIKLTPQDIVNNVSFSENKETVEENCINDSSSDPKQKLNQASLNVFHYSRAKNRFTVKGDYSILFSVIEDYLIMKKFKIEEKDINAGYIKIKNNNYHRQFIIFYSEDDEIVIDFAKNDISFFNSINNLMSTVDEALFQYKNDKLQFKQKYHATPPTYFHKYEVDYTSTIKEWVIITPLVYIVYFFLGGFVSDKEIFQIGVVSWMRIFQIGILPLCIIFLIIRIIYLIKNFQSRTKKNIGLFLLFVCIFLDIFFTSLICFLLQVYIVNISYYKLI